MINSSSLRLCISDLHLDDSHPERTQALVDLLAYFDERISELYILGDLFNYWVGDDHRPACAERVSAATRALPYTGWIFGNRDFLLGTDGYCEESRMTPLPQVHHLDMAGKRAILCHGDQLCINDIEHQRNRRLYITSNYQRMLLGKSVDERLQIANQSRYVSSQRKQTLEEDIIDVDPQEVERMLVGERAELLVHGHTHRPALHRHKQGRRLVLGEWTTRGWVVIESLDRPHIILSSFAIPFDAASFQQLATIGANQQA